MDFQILPFGERAVIIQFGHDINPKIHQDVQLVSFYLDKHPPKWMIEYIPAFTTITILYHPTYLTYEEVCHEINLLLRQATTTELVEHRVIDIPVCYGGEMGPDLEYVAKANGLTSNEVIDIHSSGSYLVYMLGFSPGFPYIGGMSDKIATARKATPRLKIPAGSVGIAGAQTGIYPIETPGGWQLIGRTPIRLFLPNIEPPSFLIAGDRIHFVPITLEEFRELEMHQSDYHL